MKKALIVQGGGFRTAFSAGVLDAFLKNNFTDFDLFASVSGGAIAASYFVANQKEHCINSICYLAGNERFLTYSRFIRSKPIMDVDIFYDISNHYFPFDFSTAEKNTSGKKFVIVMTNKQNGLPFYFNPVAKDWQDAVVASCSLPFITKGKHSINGIEYMDGAWGDPLPVKWVAKQGVNEIIIVRTSPLDEKIGKSLLDRVGELYYRKNPELKNAFAKNHEHYNDAIDFINHSEIKIHQIAPESNLKAGLYTSSKSLILSDYQYGFKEGEKFCFNLHK